MVAQNPSPVISRHLEKGGEMLYIIVEAINEPEVAGDVFRLRAHFHSAGSPRWAGWNNIVVRDETGNKYELRFSLIKFLLDKRDDGWRQTGASVVASPAEAEFWRLDNL
jgi:hypothetical protein